MSATRIVDVRAGEVLDSRGMPTLAATVILADGSAGSAVAPSGASTGRGEAHVLLDGGERFGGTGVRTAVRHVREELRAAVMGLDAADQPALDTALRACDGTPDLRRLGANAVLPVSVAAVCALAASQRSPLFQVLAAAAGTVPLLPLPMVNIVSGGAHAGGAVDVQDVLAVPVGAASFHQAIEWVWRVRRSAAAVLSDLGMPPVLVADEGGFGPTLPTNAAALEVVARAVEEAGLRAGDDVAIAVDVAASQLIGADGRYTLHAEGRCLDTSEWFEEVDGWVRRFPVVSLEDVAGEDDWAGWVDATGRWGGAVQLLGDDLLTTSPDRVDRAIREGAANAVLVKPNQVGTLSDAARVVSLARGARWGTVVSARSGDTEESWLADLAVGWAAGQIKVGSLTRSERTAKWNRLLRVEDEFGDEVGWAGAAALVGSGGGTR